MNLIIDIGNTRTKLAVFKQDSIKKVITIKTGELLKNVKLIFKKENITQSIISSVAKTPNKTFNFLKKNSKSYSNMRLVNNKAKRDYYLILNIFVIVILKLYVF